MQPPDPTERFNGVTEIDFAVNEEELQSEFQTARVLVRFHGEKKRKVPSYPQGASVCWCTGAFVPDFSGG